VNAVSYLSFLILLIRATHILNNRYQYGRIEGIMNTADHHKKDQIINIVTCMTDCRRFGLVIRCIEHLQIVTTSNYSAIANSRTLQFTIAGTMSSESAISSPVVAW
jgi:hypothetical protein